MLRRSALRCQSPPAAGINTTAAHADIVIVGAGILGTYTALELARGAHKNCKIVVVDENARPGQGSTCYSSGIIRAFYSVRETARLSWEAYHVWQSIGEWLRLPAATHQQQQIAHMRQCPGWFQRTERNLQFLNSFLEVAAELKIPVNELDTQQTLAFAKSIGNWNVHDQFALRRIDADDVATPEIANKYPAPTSFVVPGTGYVADPGLATANAAAAAVAAGRHSGCSVEFRCSTRVIAIVKNKQGDVVTGVRVVNSNRDVSEIVAPIVINCAGPASSAITRMAFDDGHCTVANDMTVTTRPLRAEVAVVPAPPCATTNQVITFDTDLGWYVRPEGARNLCIGGLDFPDDPHELEYTNTDETRGASAVKGDGSVAEEGKSQSHAFVPGEQAMIHVARAAVRMPELQLPSRPAFVTSYYDVTEDWTPVCDESALPGFFMLVGSSGNCFKIAPLLGKLMAATVAGKHSIDLPLSTPAGHSSEFQRRIFARNRDILAESSNSVIG